MEVLPTSVPFSVNHVDTRLEQNSFDKLVTSLTETLGPSSGLTLDDVNVTSLMCLMKLYDSRDCEWSKYAFGDSDKDYTRNLVDEGSGKSNLVCILYARSI
jgi:cysteine dioxygenase